MTDLTVLADLVYSAVDVVWWVGIAAVACSMALLILFASMPAFDWLFATSQRRRTGHKPSTAGNDPQRTATAPNNLRSRQRREEPTEDNTAQQEEKIPSNVYSDIYATPLGSYVLPC